MKLAEVIDSYVSGDWGSDTFSDITPNVVYCIRGADIVPITSNQFEEIPQRYVSDKTLKSKLLQEGDIVIEKSGGSPTQSTGRVVYVSKELIEAKGNIVCSNFCTTIRIKNGWNPLYVYYYWMLIYNSGVFFNFEGKTSGIKNLLLDVALSSIDIEEISIDEQNRIVDAIFPIEKNMATNRTINHNLEEMAKQLYDYWFVQFDFPDEKGRPYKSSGGKMVWNEKLKREIPQGWKVKELHDVVEIKNGATPSTTDENNYGGDVIWITPKDLSCQQSKFIYQGERNITKKGYDSCSTSLLPIGSVLLSSRAPIGLLAIASETLCTNQGFKNLVPHNDFDTHYLYYYVKCHISQIEQLGTGTTFKEISKEDLYRFPILTYNNSKMSFKVWEKVMNQISDKQLVLFKEIAKLTKLRDELLPLLMNGQVSVNYDL